MMLKTLFSLFIPKQVNTDYIKLCTKSFVMLASVRTLKNLSNAKIHCDKE